MYNNIFGEVDILVCILVKCGNNIKYIVPSKHYFTHCKWYLHMEFYEYPQISFSEHFDAAHQHARKTLTQKFVRNLRFLV